MCRYRERAVLVAGGYAAQVQAIYLAHPPASDGDALGMSNYRTYYRDAASPGHQGYIDDIFTQNDTD